MIESLAGRLKWERTENGIRVEIPDPASFVECLAIITVATVPFFVYGLFGGFNPPIRSWAVAMVGALALLLVLPRGKEFIGQKRLMTLTSDALTVTTLPRCRESRKQPTYTLWNLRSNPRISVTGKEHPDEVQVEIDSTSGTWTIASGLSEAEAATLILRMTEVFVFPEWMPAYKAAVSDLIAEGN